MAAGISPRTAAARGCHAMTRSRIAFPRKGSGTAAKSGNSAVAVFGKIAAYFPPLSALAAWVNDSQASETCSGMPAFFAAASSVVRNAPPMVLAMGQRFRRSARGCPASAFGTKSANCIRPSTRECSPAGTASLRSTATSARSSATAFAQVSVRPAEKRHSTPGSAACSSAMRGRMSHSMLLLLVITRITRGVARHSLAKSSSPPRAVSASFARRVPAAVSLSVRPVRVVSSTPKHSSSSRSCLL